MTTAARSHNQTAAERRDAVLDAAITEFAQKGLHGTATEDIARRAGISQPYIFRLFGTKKDLFLAAADRVYERIHARFEAAAPEPPDPLTSMGRSYAHLLNDREELLMLLHSIAASDDPEVGARVRARFGALYERVKAIAGVDDAEARAFFAKGMLLTVLAAIDLPDILGVSSWGAFNDDVCQALMRELT